MEIRISSETVTTARAELPPAPEGWLESGLAKLPALGGRLAMATDGDGVMREAVLAGRELFGFERMGIWLLEEDGRRARGTFGVDPSGELVDERSIRLYDETGFIREMSECWSRSPYFFEKADGLLRSAEARVVGRGGHVTAPLLRGLTVFGFVAVDDLIACEAVNRSTGSLLCQFGAAVASAYTQRRLEREVAERRALAEECERVKNEFLGMVGHEIRTPLNAIMGYAQLLTMRNQSVDTTELAGIIEECCGHLSGVVESIMEYSQLAGCEAERCRQPADPVAALEATVRSFGKMYADKGLDLTFRHEGVEGVAALVDAVGLRQILGNLLQNALKFTDRGGVRVEAQSRLDGEDRIEFLVKVADTGIGMEGEAIERIFQPFCQLGKGSGERAGGGIGMGLAIVKRLAQALGGSIACRSAPGRGTEFSLSFSLELAGEPGRRAGTKSEALRRMRRSRERSGGRRVLLVEDDERNREAMRSMAACLGFERVDVARDGSEALDLLEERPYDLILMDVEMPRLNGLEVTRQVRRAERSPLNRGARIVGVTAFTAKHDREVCLMAGMNDYLAKPVQLESLRRALQGP